MAEIWSFHLARTEVLTLCRALGREPGSWGIPGLRFAECLAQMRLGAPIFSPSRLQLRQLVMLARWEEAEALREFLVGSQLGRVLAGGWHVQMQLARRWGEMAEWADLPSRVGEVGARDPVVAVTLARMRLPEVPRFIRWGRPVEELVRDHPGKTFATAALRLPRTVSTFSIWKRQGEMEDMVWGHGQGENPERHVRAMAERERKDFHFEFSTLRFVPLCEEGSWEGRRLLPR